MDDQKPSQDGSGPASDEAGEPTPEASRTAVSSELEATGSVSAQSDEVSSSASESSAPEDASVSGKSRTRMALVITVVVLLAAVWPAMRIYEWRRGEAFRKACEQARVTQNWKQEELAAQAWLDYDPESGSAWVFLAEAAYELNELERSAEALGNVPEDDERALICYYEKANLEWTHLNKPLEGLETCERILALDSRVLEAHARVISFYALTLRRVEMLKAIRAAVESGAEPKESYTYLIMADNLAFTNASDLASRWMSSNPENQTLRVALAVQTALRLAMESEATAKIDAREMELEAVERLEEFLDVFPNDPVLLGFLLDHYTESGNVDRVEKLLGQIQEDGAEDHMLWVHRAWYYRQTEDYAQAEAACQRALELHPMSPAARIEYSQTLRLTGRVKEVEAFEALAVRGNELRKKLVQLQSARDVTGEQLELIQQYAADCDDVMVAQALETRLNEK